MGASPPFTAAAVPAPKALLRPRLPHPMSPLPPDHRLDQHRAPQVLDAVARLARSCSDERLALTAGAGLVLAALVVTLLPSYWPAALAALSLAGFGGWGIADRSASDLERHPMPSAIRLGALHALALACAVLGVGAAIVLIVTLVALALASGSLTWS